MADLKKSKVIFIVGGPGSGKGTLCAKLVTKYGYTHLSSGDLLRAEVASGSARGKDLDATMKRGDLVPQDIALQLIREAMQAKAATSKGFLIDGYPRDVAQGERFEKEIAPCEFVLYVDATDENMTKRSKQRARNDDTDEAIKKRLKVFQDATKPVIDHYTKQGKLKKVDGNASADAVFAEASKIVDACAGCLKKAKVIFLVGGPGAGKGTLCGKLVTKYGYTHLSSGDLLRAEVASGSARGKALDATMREGGLVPSDVALQLIREAMQAKAAVSKGFLIDGYPRDVAQGEQFEKEIAPCELVLFVDATDENMTKRSKQRARNDDTEEAIKKRLKVFQDATKPVIDHYTKQGKLKKVDGNASADAAFAEVTKILDSSAGDLKKSKVVFIIGGPGSGKGTLCAKLVNKHGLIHLSSGDLLRAEVASGSARGKALDATMREGGLVAIDIVQQLIREAMLAKAATAKGFLLDGYPRDAAQGDLFEKEIAPCQLVLYVDAKDDTMTKRSKQRARNDDTDEAIKKRLKIFHDATKPVIDHYSKQGKVRKLNGEASADAVFAEASAIIDKEIK